MTTFAEPLLGYMPLTAESLQRAYDLFAAMNRAPDVLLLGQATAKDLESRYAWQAENPTHDIFDGYNWHHGMKAVVIARGLLKRRKRRALCRSRLAGCR
jgi:hypothetical protein